MQQNSDTKNGSEMDEFIRVSKMGTENRKKCLGNGEVKTREYTNTTLHYDRLGSSPTPSSISAFTDRRDVRFHSFTKLPLELRLSHTGQRGVLVIHNSIFDNLALCIGGYTSSLLSFISTLKTNKMDA